MQELIIATNNAGKAREFKAILGNDFEIKTLKDINLDIDIVEDADTFFGNAFKKASTIAKLTNKITLADDSGLVVDALDGAPGVYTARYSGVGATDASNRKKLLNEMVGIKDRSARFKCCLVLYYPDGTFVQAEGSTEGSILYEEEGSNGFGYDSIFYSNDLKMSFGIADAEVKNAISHRGRAIKELKAQLG